MKALLIYELVPEETRFYALELQKDSELHETLSISNGKFLNQTKLTEEEEVALEHLSVYLEKIIPLDAEKPLFGPWDVVFHTGFFL